MAFIAPEMSFVASGVRSVGVSNGASRLRNSSLLLEFDLAKFRPSCELVFILEDSISFDGNIARSSGFALRQSETPLHLLIKVELLWSRAHIRFGKNASELKFAGVFHLNTRAIWNRNIPNEKT
jgi:hypothetical protein